MARFVTNVAVQTAEPKVAVDGTLPAGNHTFELVVTDDAGNKSLPARLVVVIRQSVIAQPVIR
jgi:hypothetical protein